MYAQDVNLAALIPEKRAKTLHHPEERLVTGRTVWLPVRQGNHKKQVLRIQRHVRLPEVLEVVVVQRRPATLDLGEDATPVVQTKERSLDALE